MLKETRVKLGYIHDHDTLIRIMKAIRGGICGIGEVGYAEADTNNHILCLDVNNLYGYAMCQYLPTEIIESKPVNEEESETILKEALSLSKDSKYGMLLEVDIEYPQTLHKDHNAYPLAP
jgi:hypothetical protein